MLDHEIYYLEHDMNALSILLKGPPITAAGEVIKMEEILI